MSVETPIYNKSHVLMIQRRPTNDTTCINLSCKKQSALLLPARPVERNRGGSSGLSSSRAAHQNTLWSCQATWLGRSIMGLGRAALKTPPKSSYACTHIHIPSHIINHQLVDSKSHQIQLFIWIVLSIRKLALNKLNVARNKVVFGI